MTQDPVPSPETERPTQERTGRAAALSFGRYRLLQRVGEGGMGEVWLAEQTEPVRRQVALKVIKAGMDTAQVVARFEAERQALALMDHPTIATVFDGGTHAGGPAVLRDGVREGRADHDVLRPPPAHARRSGSQLFIQVCEGVQHAHQKGIIHRDLKPSNVLVTIQDDRPVPKIIDFGVAKATAQQLTERDALHRARRAHRHARVHEPRAGRDGRPRHRHAHRRLRPRRPALRAADRRAAVRPQGAAAGGLRRDPADHPREGAAAPEHADHAARAGLDRGRERIGTPSRAGSAASCAATSTGSR